jgi:lipid-A-disaccharide synthase
MEPPIYARHGVDARFVGHPLADAMPLEPDQAAARAQLGLAGDAPVLAVLPGSRLGEIARLGADFLDAATRVARQVPDLQVVVPAANAACRAALERLLADVAPSLQHVRLIDGQARVAMVASDVVLLASGTATLEAMLAKRPMVVAYKVAPLTYTIVKRLGLLKVNRYALPNILAGDDVVPELMQHDCTPRALADALLAWFRDPAARGALAPRFRDLHRQLQRDASEAAAQAIADVVSSARG